MRISDWSSDVCSSDLNPNSTNVHFADHPRLVMTGEVASELKTGCLGEGPHQFFGGSRLDQDAVRLVVFLADHLFSTYGRPHVAHVVRASRRKRSLLKHGRPRSDERRLGKACVSPCRSRWWRSN